MENTKKDNQICLEDYIQTFLTAILEEIIPLHHIVYKEKDCFLAEHIICSLSEYEEELTWGEELFGEICKYESVAIDIVDKVQNNSKLYKYVHAIRNKLNKIDVNDLRKTLWLVLEYENEYVCHDTGLNYHIPFHFIGTLWEEAEHLYLFIDNCVDKTTYKTIDVVSGRSSSGDSSIGLPPLKDSDCLKKAILTTYNEYKLKKKEFSLFYLVTKGVIDKHCTQEQMLGYINESGIPSDKLPKISSIKALTTNKDYPNWNIQGIGINDKERCDEIGKCFYEEFKRLKNDQETD